MLSAPSAIAFAALTLALAALWLPRWSDAPRVARLWTVPFAVAVAAALAGRILDVRAVVALLFYAVACRAANRASGARVSLLSHLLMLAITAGLMLHVIPGFDNPRVIADAVLSPGGLAYTKYLNIDKGLAGLFLLGIYAPQLAREDRFRERLGAWAWRFAVLVAVVIPLSLASGFVAWDPKWPSWFPVWAWSMVFLTALPEEALFRGVVQSGLEPRVGRRGALAAGAALFGIAHAGGGPLYVLLATMAGAGYGWIYAGTRSIAAAILAHAGLNAIHFLFFTYPALAR